MTILLRHNAKLELTRADYVGSVTLEELLALAAFNAAEPQWLKHDCLSLVLPGTDFLSVDFKQLDAIFERYRQMYGPMRFHIMRRSAWLCLSPAARAHVDYWVIDRDTKQQLSTNLRLFESFEEAGDWLMLQPAELDELKSGEGFDIVYRSEIASRAASA